LGAHVARVNHVCAIGGDVDQALLRSCAVGAKTAHVARTKSHLLVIQPLVLNIRAGVESEAGKNAHQLRGVAAGGGKAIDIAGGDQGAVFGRTEGHARNLGGNHYRFHYLSDGQLDLWDREAVAGKHFDAVTFHDSKPVLLTWML